MVLILGNASLRYISLDRAGILLETVLVHWSRCIECRVSVLTFDDADHQLAVRVNG